MGILMFKVSKRPCRSSRHDKIICRGVVAPPANNLIMSGTSTRSFRHLEHQNPSIIQKFRALRALPSSSCGGLGGPSGPFWGPSAPSFVAKCQNKKGPKMVPKWTKSSQKVVQSGPKVVPKWSQNGPKVVPKWFHSGSKGFPKWSFPKWSQSSPKVVPKWSQNGSKVVLK